MDKEGNDKEWGGEGVGWTMRVMTRSGLDKEGYDKEGNDKEWGGLGGWTRRVMTRSGVDKEGGQGG